MTIDETSCPSEAARIRCALGELTVNETRAHEAHRAACARCREEGARLEALLGELAADPGDGPTAHAAFVSQVVARARTQEKAAPRRATARRFAFAAAAALLALAPALWLAGGRAPAGTFQARGGTSGRPAATAAIVRVRGGRAEPVSGAIAPGDALGVRCSNRSEAPVYLLAFLVDGAREVHWIFPAYADPARPPQARRVDPGADGALLEELVEPDGVAPGPLRLATVLLRAPIDVAEAERRIAALAPGAALAPAFPDGQVDERRASYEARGGGR